MSLHTIPHGHANGWTTSRDGPDFTIRSQLHSSRPSTQRHTQHRQCSRIRASFIASLHQPLTQPVAPPPTRTNEKPDTMARWQTDNRRFAPWQYQAKYLVTSQQGTTSLAPASMREQMMGFSGSHTANMTHDPTEYHRNKALGNTWHVPTATWLLFLLLLNTLAVPATTVSYTPIQRATAIWLANPVHFGPPPRPTPHLYMPQFSWQDHLQWARTYWTTATPRRRWTLPWHGASRQQRLSTHSPNSANRQSRRYDSWSKTWRKSQTPGDHSCHHTCTMLTPLRGAPLRSPCSYTC